MRAENRLKRESEIIAAAYRVLDTAGPAGLSMLAVAREAKASNETLYRWYGDKNGLYAALVADNAARIEASLTTAIVQHSDPVATLIAIGTQLFDMVTGERAVALNRAAAADPSNNLGAELAKGGRQRLQPLIASIAGQITPHADPAEAAAVFIDLLLGDIQVRRATGGAPLPQPGTGQQRATSAVGRLQRLFAPGLAGETGSR